MGQLRDVRQVRETTHTEVAAHAWIRKVDDPALGKEKTDSQQKFTAVKTFLETRTLWSIYTRDVASRLTESMVLRSFTGISKLPVGRPGLRRQEAAHG